MSKFPRRRKATSLTPEERKFVAIARLQQVAEYNPEKLRQVVRLAFMAGLTANEISAASGLPLWEIKEME